MEGRHSVRAWMLIESMVRMDRGTRGGKRKEKEGSAGKEGVDTDTQKKTTKNTGQTTSTGKEAHADRTRLRQGAQTTLPHHLSQEG
jgi:hypothetical protein